MKSRANLGLKLRLTPSRDCLFCVDSHDVARGSQHEHRTGDGASEFHPLLDLHGLAAGGVS